MRSPMYVYRPRRHTHWSRPDRSNDYRRFNRVMPNVCTRWRKTRPQRVAPQPCAGSPCPKGSSNLLCALSSMKKCRHVSRVDFRGRTTLAEPVPFCSVGDVVSVEYSPHSMFRVRHADSSDRLRAGNDWRGNESIVQRDSGRFAPNWWHSRRLGGRQQDLGQDLQRVAPSL